MTDPQRAKDVDPAVKKEQGRDDPTGWEHGGIDTLRDTRGGTYGGLPGKDDPAQVKEHATTLEEEQSGADVRPNAAPMPETLPKGLQHERKGPYNKTTGRRPEKE